MERPSAQQLTHPYPAWAGCTMKELIGVAFLCGGFLLILLFIVGLATRHLTLSLLPWPLLTGAMTKIGVKQLAKTKETRPYGFATITARLWLEKKVGLKTPYLSRQGRWSTKVR